MERVAKEWLSEHSLAISDWSFQTSNKWKDRKGFLMCTLTQKPSQYYTDMIRNAMKCNHDEYIGNRKKKISKLHDEWNYAPIRLNNVECFLVTRKTTSDIPESCCDLPQDQIHFKCQVRHLIRSHNDILKGDIHNLIAQAVDLEMERQNQREQGKFTFFL